MTQIWLESETAASKKVLKKEGRKHGRKRK